MDPRRLRRVAAALLLAAVCASTGAQERPASIRMLVQSSPLAGFRHYEAGSAWDDLRVGDALQLVREADNAHDANAVAVLWRGRMLGYVPRRQNAALARAMDQGEPLTARISRLSAHPNPAQRFEFEVYVE